ncbi:hypothetical protein [Streptomyces sp. SAJ15]|uniref:hypothetical protein n=1 Tax=Streptomyces sp. SAJ15 TaxID=2011095 RepID=UPI00118552B6|nr:hypothetical protein [Streptomyces sp. SAJ15]TVL89787.1 hypothetical protein CD790_25665 [Streptomyces sp. SAJ15]
MHRDFDLSFELRVALTDHYGRKSEWPHGLNIARDLLVAMPLAWPDELARFLRCCQEANAHHREHGRHQYYEHSLSRSLMREYGTENDPDRNAAYNIYRTIRTIAGEQAADQLLECTLQVLTEAAELATT